MCQGTTGDTVKKILIIGTGGTIASKKDKNIHLDNPFKILDYVDFERNEFECASPFSILSENIDFHHWKKLIDYLNQVDFCKYEGVIILHGSDTLAYTGAVIANIFSDKNIVLVASGKPVEDEDSNATANFTNAVKRIKSGKTGVYISYDKLMPAMQTVSADSNDKFIDIGKSSLPADSLTLNNKNILIIKPYVNINYDNFNLDGVDAVLHEMYHSATAPKNSLDFIDKCKALNIPFYFVTAKESADYESASDFENIIFNSTIENAYAKMLLTK